MEYDVNFDLRIERKQNDSYKVTLLPPSGVEECLSEGIFSSEVMADIARLEHYFSQEDDPPSENAKPNQEKTQPVDGKFLQALGEKLFACLFRGKVGNAFYEAYGTVRDHDDKGLRLRLMIDAPEVAALPWELMFEKNRFLSTWEKVSVTRYLKLAPKNVQFEITPPVRVLVAIPEGSELNVLEEQEIVSEAFESLVERELIKLDFLKGCVSVESILKRLSNKDDEFHVFHFIGHGCFDGDDDDEGYLRLNLDPAARPRKNDTRGELEREGWLRADSFADLFINHPSLKLVVLNSCQGARLSKTKPLAGLAPRLFSRDIPAVVAMQYPVFDDSAITFSREFYERLCDPRDFGLLDVAVSNARKVIHIQRREDPDFVTPVLFMNSASGAIFDRDDEAELDEATVKADNAKPTPGPDVKTGRRRRRSRSSRERARGGYPSLAFNVKLSRSPGVQSLFHSLWQKITAPFLLIDDQRRLKAVSLAREETLATLKQEERSTYEPAERERLSQVIAGEEKKLARAQERLADAVRVSVRFSRATIVISLLLFIAAIFGIFNAFGIDDLLQQKAASLRGADTRTFGNGQIRLIAVDPTQQVNGFPNLNDGKQDRQQHARLINALADAKAKVVVLDLSYEEAPDAPDKGTSRWDGELAAAINRASDKGTQVIVGVDDVNQDGTPKVGFPSSLTESLQNRWGNIKVGLKYELGPIKVGNGLDGLRTVVRYVELGKEKNVDTNHEIPPGAVPISASLMLETLRKFAAEDSTAVPGAFFYPNEKKIKFLASKGNPLMEIPVLDDEMSFMFEPAKEEALKPFRRTFQDLYQQLIYNRGLKENYEGTIVLVGYHEGVDLHNVGGGRKMYGMDIHASVLSNIFQQVYIKKLRWEFNLLIILIMAMIGYLLQTDRVRRLTLTVPLDTKLMRRVLRLPVPLIVVTLVYFVIMYLVYTRTYYFIDMTYHIAALFISYWVAGVRRKTRTTSLAAAPEQRSNTLVEV